MEKVLFYFAMLYKGDWDLIYKAIKNLEEFSEEQCEQFRNEVKSNYITLLSPLYPERLKQVDKPPFVLFYYGNINLLQNQDTIAIVGGNTEYAKTKAYQSATYLSISDYTIVSGMRKGSECKAHLGALASRTQSTIAVLNYGIDYQFTSFEELRNRIIENGVVISEFPGELKLIQKNYVSHNRIIAGLSKGILVSEIKPIPKENIIVFYGLDYGKDIFAFPSVSEIFNGTNQLIKDGAILVENGSDIVKYYRN